LFAARRVAGRHLRPYLARCSLARLVPIVLNVVMIWLAEVSAKYLGPAGAAASGLAQFCRIDEFPDPTRTVEIVMLSFLMFWQTPVPSVDLYMRLSILVWALYQRSCVFRPSVRRMMIFRAPAGGAGAFIGSLCVSACHPHARPIGWLVVPAATMASILALRD